jgi:hypothetical protein
MTTMRSTCITLLSISTLVAVSIAAVPRVAHAQPTAQACIAAHESSIGLRKRQALLQARDELRVCSASACPAHIRHECTTRLVEVNAGVAGVVLEIVDGAGRDVSATSTVALDSRPTSVAADGAPIEMDPGEHVLVVESSGRRREVRFTVAAGEKGRRERIVLGEPSPSPSSAPPAAVVPAVASTTSTPPRDDAPAAAPRASGSSTTRTLAYVTGGVGLAALAAGTYFGLSARSSWSASQSACASASDCTDRLRAVSERGDAERSATFSTIALGVGAAALVAGVVLFLASPSTSDTPSASTPVPGRWTF